MELVLQRMVRFITTAEDYSAMLDTFMWQSSRTISVSSA